jgi:hypothetical protein
MHLYGKTIYYLRLQWKDEFLKIKILFLRINLSIVILLLCRFIILFINFCLSLTCLL